MILLAAMALSSAACGGSDRASSPVVVYSASSLADAMEEVGARFSAETGHRVEVRAGASGALAQGIRHGAPADLFVSAHPSWVDELQTDGLIDPGSRITIGQNRLVVVVPVGSAVVLASIKDLASLPRIAVGDPETVPAGTYAREALVAAGIWDRIEPNRVQAGDVRQALLWAERGEADAAIVYASDARASGKVWIALEIPPRLYAPILCTAAATRHGGGESARLLLRFLEGDRGREVLARHGILAPGRS